MGDPSRPEPSRTAEHLHSAAIRLLRRLRRADEAAGVGPARLSALSVLVYGGVHTLGELAAAEQVSAPTMSRLVSAMEADDLVRRTRDSEDGRVVRLRASARGRRILGAARRRRLTLLDSWIETLPRADRARLREAAELLDRVARADPAS